MHLGVGSLLCKRYYENRGLDVVTLVSDNTGEAPLTVRRDAVAEIYKLAGVFF